MQPQRSPITPVPPPAATRALHATGWLLVLALLAALLGYQIGRDVAERDNRADCVAAGTGCR